jgi:hypothetical protein
LLVVALSGCIQSQKTLENQTKSNLSPLKEILNRTDGSHYIRAFQSQDQKVRLTIIENLAAKDFTAMGLANEIIYSVPNLLPDAFAQPLQTYDLYGHTAVSMSIVQTDAEHQIVSNPAQYVTVIAYPERNMIMTFITNAEGTTWDDHFRLVDEYKIP